MSNIKIKKINIMASYDWSMRAAMINFVQFLEPVINFKKKKYKWQRKTETAQKNL